MTEKKQYHFVVMYNAETGEFEMDYDSLSTRFHDGESIYNAETEEWERVTDDIWENDNSTYNRAGDALADSIRTLEALPLREGKNV